MSTPSNESAATPPVRSYAEPRGEWPGHALRTRYVLEPLQLRCAVQEDPKISQSERVLLNACEFWAATARHTLLNHLGRAPHWRLTLAREALEGCGGTGVARIVKKYASTLPVRPARAAVERVAQALETELGPMAEDIDALLARFASRIMTDEKSGIPLAHVQPRLEALRARTPSARGCE